MILKRALTFTEVISDEEKCNNIGSLNVFCSVGHLRRLLPGFQPKLNHGQVVYPTDDTDRERGDFYCFLERGVRATVNLNPASLKNILT